MSCGGNCKCGGNCRCGKAADVNYQEYFIVCPKCGNDGDTHIGEDILLLGKTEYGMDLETDEGIEAWCNVCNDSFELNAESFSAESNIINIPCIIDGQEAILTNDPNVGGNEGMMFLFDDIFEWAMKDDLWKEKMKRLNRDMKKVFNENNIPLHEGVSADDYGIQLKKVDCSHDNLGIKTMEQLNGELLLTLVCDACGKRTSTSAPIEGDAWDAESHDFSQKSAESFGAETFEAFKYGENNKYWKMRKNAYLRNNKRINSYEEKDWEKIFKNGIAPQNDEEMVEWIKNHQLTDDNLKYGMSRANTLSRINAVLSSYFDERMYFRPYGAESFAADGSGKSLRRDVIYEAWSKWKDGVFPHQMDNLTTPEVSWLYEKGDAYPPFDIEDWYKTTPETFNAESHDFSQKSAESFAAKEGFDRNCKVCKGTGWDAEEGRPKKRR